MRSIAKTLYLYVLTHTETYYNKNRIFCGTMNSVLTKLGHRQAEKIAKKLKDKKIDLAFLSPLTRSKQTLAYILKYHPNLEAIVDERINERDYGRLTRKSKIKYKRDSPRLYEIYHRSYRTSPPGGESMVEVENRVRSFLKDTVALMRRKKANALIIAHNNSIRPIRRYFEKLTPKEMMKHDNYNKIFTYKIKGL